MTEGDGSSSVDRIIADYIASSESGTAVSVETILAEHPSLRVELEKRFEALLLIDRGFSEMRSSVSNQSGDSVPAAQHPTVQAFDVLEELGRGGNSIVYLAKQRSLNRLVALKTLKTGGKPDEQALKRFQREAEVVAKLNHPNIASIYDYGHEGNAFYLALEYIDGAPLSAIIKYLKDSRRINAVKGDDLQDGLTQLSRQRTDHKEGEDAAADSPVGRSYVESCGRIILRIAKALGVAHAHGIIHRDIKPSNIILNRSGIPYLIDFGLTKDESVFALTGTSDFLGTIYYASPEQVEGDAKQITAACDVYSLGATLYELLTWSRPHHGTTIAQISRKILSSDPVPVRKLNPLVPPDLATIIETCMRKEPGRRYRDANALAQDLDNFFSYRPIAATPTGTLTRLYYGVRRRPAIALSVILGTGFAICAGMFFHKFKQKNQQLIQQQAREHLLAGGLYNNLNAGPQAVEEFSKAISIDPSNGVAYLERARTSLFLLNNSSEAAKDLRQAEKLGGVNPDLIAGLRAQIKSVGNDRDAAIRIERQLFSRNPRDAFGASRLSSQLIAKGQLTEGLKIIDKALLANPTDYFLHYQKADVILKMASNNKTASSRDDLVLRHLMLARQYLPQSGASESLIYLIYTSLADEYGRRHDEKSTETLLREGIKRIRNSAGLRVALVYSLLRTHRFLEAEKELLVLSELAPNTTNYHLMLGMALAGQGKLLKAAEAYERDLATGNVLWQTIAVAGGINRQLGNLKRAQELFASAAKQVPDNAFIKQQRFEIDALLRLQERRRPELLESIRSNGGYVDDGAKFGFVPPKAWERVRMPWDSEGVYFQETAYTGQVKPNIRIGIMATAMSPGELFEVGLSSIDAVGGAIHNVVKSTMTISDVMVGVFTYDATIGGTHTRMRRYDARVKEISFLFTCGAPPDEFERVSSICQAAVNSSVFPGN